MHSFSTSSSVTCLSQHNSTLLSPIKSSLITLVYYSFVYSISGAFILCSLLLSFTFYANAYLFNLTVNVLMQMHHSLKHYLVQTSTQLFGDDDGDVMVVMTAILTTTSPIYLIVFFPRLWPWKATISWSLVIDLFSCIHSFDSEYFRRVFYTLEPI